MENEYGRTVLMEERFERNNEEVEIDLLEILRVMLGKAWLIILCVCGRDSCFWLYEASYSAAIFCNC